MSINVYDIIITATCLLITIVAHELAHGLTAYAMGDTTARDAGRLTLNPIPHIDPMGALCMLLFRFGWAKPVPINPYRFKKRKLGMILVSAAGAVTNLFLAFISMFILAKMKFHQPILLDLLQYLVIYNVYFAVFNLLPFPPLDGSKILFTLMPGQVEAFFYRYERYFSIILLVLVFTRMLGRFLIPMAQLIISWMLQVIG